MTDAYQTAIFYTELALFARLTSKEVQDYWGVIGRIFRSNDRNEQPRDTLKDMPFTLDNSLEHLVLPSLRKLLGINGTSDNDLSKVEIVLQKDGDLALPFIECDREINAPITHLIPFLKNNHQLASQIYSNFARFLQHKYTFDNDLKVLFLRWIILSQIIICHESFLLRNGKTWSETADDLICPE